jgi:AraC family transcriptional regulator of adaptative response/methylated-DNA-[protein]-cysteine methyltransferase
MSTTELPTRRVMLAAFRGRDASFDGVFFTAVKTTGIFCRPTCPARKPQPENVEFFGTAREATFAGYRPCKRCFPLVPSGQAPDWLRPLLDQVEAEPAKRRRDADLRERGLSPERVRRWFQQEHGMSFHAYNRGSRLGLALARLGDGGGVLTAGLDAGWDSASGFSAALFQLAGRSPGRARDATVVRVRRLLTPLGAMVAGATDEGLCLLEFAERRMLERRLETLRRRLDAVLTPGDHPHLATIAEELAAYFAGDDAGFSVPLVMPGTEFQLQVWSALQRLPRGTTTGYGALAAELGRPTAARAVARANGDNRIAIVIPCHRVIGADGSLTGYAGGKWRKQRLLELEGAGRPS